MDEPTASLSAKEVDKLFQIVENLKKQGIAIIYISHRMNEILSIADKVTVLGCPVSNNSHETLYISQDRHYSVITVVEPGVKWASKNMLVLGFIILGGLALHLFNFWAKMQHALINGK